MDAKMKSKIGGVTILDLDLVIKLCLPIGPQELALKTDLWAVKEGKAKSLIAQFDPKWLFFEECEKHIDGKTYCYRYYTHPQNREANPL